MENRCAFYVHECWLASYIPPPQTSFKNCLPLPYLMLSLKIGQQYTTIQNSIYHWFIKNCHCTDHVYKITEWYIYQAHSHSTAHHPSQSLSTTYGIPLPHFPPSWTSILGRVYPKNLLDFAPVGVTHPALLLNLSCSRPKLGGRQERHQGRLVGHRWFSSHFRRRSGMWWRRWGRSHGLRHWRFVIWRNIHPYPLYQ